MSGPIEGENPIDASFARLRGRRRGGLLPYLTAGYPDLPTTRRLLESLDTLDLAAIEVGFPYSDSIADGPVIQSSFYAAMRQGLRVADIFMAVGELRGSLRSPLLAMVSYSIVHRFGPQRFVERCHDTGIAGMIVPDISLEEAPHLAGLLADARLRLVLLVAPTSPPRRRQQLVQACTGFVYYQSVTGITGQRDRVADDLAENVAQLRKLTDLPICVGFGISRPEHVRAVCQVADGAIVGSAIVHRIAEALKTGKSPDRLVSEVTDFVRTLLAGTL